MKWVLKVKLARLSIRGCISIEQYKGREQRTGCNHHNDAGADDEPARSPPQPEAKALFSEHHLNVFDEAVPS